MKVKRISESNFSYNLQKKVTHQNIRNVLRLHDEEFIVSNNRFKELQRHRAVLVAADAAGHQLRGEI